ncbi:MAG: coproporphyrinogen III oxidase family protein [Treponema sp.]|jgi:oxygen-independent coproporphyrinogen-3 oxidase|nr:coproporphyrinogen III oxidase family protein [Treponema sp.]
MFAERYRSHHDAERRLHEALGRGNKAAAPVPWSQVEKALGEKPRGKSRAVYIHVPHCDRICAFCNLNRKERKDADLAAYTEYLIAEIAAYGAYPYIREQAFDAVYFGGGTPTVLDTEPLTRILRALRDELPLKEDCEITLESTQHNLSIEKALALQEAGVNRLSIGIQTFAPEGRKLFNRTYDAERSRAALQALREHFRGTLGIDIIYSYPGQSLEALGDDADTAAAMKVDSVSFYSLMIQEGSALGRGMPRREGENETPGTSFTRTIEWDKERHHLFYSRLREAGFTLLELSKLARPGKDRYQYIHTLYENGDLLPIGSGAGGKIAGFPVFSLAPGRRFVSPPQERYERYYTVLGYLQFGLYEPERIAAALGKPAEWAAPALGEKLRFFADAGLLEQRTEGSGYRLSADGVFWGNNLAVEILKAAIAAEQGREE